MIRKLVVYSVFTFELFTDIESAILIYYIPHFIKRSCIISIQQLSKQFFHSFQKISSFFMHVLFVGKLSFQNLVPIVVLCFLVFIVGVEFIISVVIPSGYKNKK
jgi:hypothetical protein